MPQSVSPKEKWVLFLPEEEGTGEQGVSSLL